MAGIKRKDNAEGQKGKVKRTKLEGSPTLKTPKNDANKVIKLDENDIVDEISGNGLDVGRRASSTKGAADATNPRHSTSTVSNCTYIPQATNFPVVNI